MKEKRIVISQKDWRAIISEIAKYMDQDSSCVCIDRHILNMLYKSTEEDPVNINSRVKSYLWRATSNLPVTTLQIEEGEAGFRVFALNFNNKLRRARTGKLRSGFELVYDTNI